MKLGFIGAGKTSAVVGGFLKSKGFSLLGYYSKTLASAEENAQITLSTAYSDISQLIKDCELIFIATPDDEISNVVNLLDGHCNNFNDKLFGTLSGALSSDTLNPLYLKGASVFTFHPPYTFPNKNINPSELEKITFMLEGNGNLFADFKNKLSACNIKYEQIESEYKPLYHAAACVAANYTVALAVAARDMQIAAGIKSDMFLQLVLASVYNAYNFEHPAQALTGPIARGDVQTIIKHMEAIGQYKPEILPLYKALGRYTADLAQEISPSAKKQILEVLSH